ncbi:MAG: hypothetical protein IKC49_02895 [Clostridia bacterium]|nr:hypothetical protein [Clostridia bacterium]
MTKNLKLSFILYLSYFAVVIAFSTIANFFNGVGIGFIGLVGILTTMLIMVFTDKYIMNRTKELFITICAFTALEFLVYFILEFNIGNLKTWKVFSVFQHIFSFFAIIFFAYTVFRFICEMKNIKIGFIEILLGNGKANKIKKAKELSNGCLEDKPKNTQPIHQDVDNSSEESTEILVEDEE